MSETKHTQHTPGPWEVRDRFYIGRRGKLSLAEVVCGDVPAEDTEQAEANARLIAAAPELLKACRMILRWCEMENSDDQEIENLTLQTVAEHAEAAIAKAEGRN